MAINGGADYSSQRLLFIPIPGGMNRLILRLKHRLIRLTTRSYRDGAGQLGAANSAP